MPKAHSPACERNKEPILAMLDEIFADRERVLEVGSGTGQHAAFFAANLPHLDWQPADRPGHLDSVRAYVAEADLDNLREPIELDLFDEPPLADYDEPIDAIVAINVIHIAPWPATERLFALASQTLSEGGLIYLYGPYRYADRPLEPSNEQFDEWLKARDARSGIRLFEDVCEVARGQGFQLVEDRAMPANNRSLLFALKS